MQVDRHQRIRHIIDRSLAGAASLKEEQTLREHVLACAQCKEYLDAGQRVIAYSRNTQNDSRVILAARLFGPSSQAKSDAVGDAWSNTFVSLRPGLWRDLLTGRECNFDSAPVALSTLFSRLQVAVLKVLSKSERYRKAAESCRRTAEKSVIPLEWLGFAADWDNMAAQTEQWAARDREFMIARFAKSAIESLTRHRGQPQ